MTWHIVEITNLTLLKKMLILMHQGFGQKLCALTTLKSHFIQILQISDLILALP